MSASSSRSGSRVAVRDPLSPSLGQRSATKRRRLSRADEPDAQPRPSSATTRLSVPRRIPSRSSSKSPLEGGEGDFALDEGYGSDGSSTASQRTPEDWVYELLVIQHPQRARACGFGDKDRRPLSPPPIIQLIVRTVTGRLVDPSDVSIDLLLLTVDLWSADCQQPLNAVMHPGSSTARQSTPPPATNIAQGAQEPTANSRPSTAEIRPPSSHYPITGWGWSSSTIPPPPPTLGPSPLTHTPGSQAVQDSLPVPSPTTAYHLAPRPCTTASTSPGRRASLAVDSRSLLRPTTAPSPSALHRERNASAHLPNTVTLPSFARLSAAINQPGPSRLPLTLHAMRDPTLARQSTSTTAGTSPTRPSTASSGADINSIPRPSWSTESSRPFTDYSFGRSSTSTWNTSSMSSDDRDPPVITGWPPPRPSTSGQSWTSASPATPLKPPLPAVMFREATVTGRVPPRKETEPSTVDPTAGQSFSRVLVGAVCAMCQRLADDDGDLGLYFFTHDLAIRTEGTFRLKFSLSNLALIVGGQMLPGAKAPILAQAYSDPFSVYSAKRFPGVVPTTALTRLFASQNVRLPTRQRRAVEAGGGQDAGAEDDLQGGGEDEDEDEEEGVE